jgi:hypothetical protein
MRAARFSQQVTKHAIGGGRRGGHNQNVPRLYHRHGRMQHQVVTRLTTNGDCGASGTRARVDGPHTGMHQPASLLCLMNGGHAECAKQMHRVWIRPGYVLDNHISQASFSITVALGMRAANVRNIVKRPCE